MASLRLSEARLLPLVATMTGSSTTVPQKLFVLKASDTLLQISLLKSIPILTDLIGKSERTASICPLTIVSFTAMMSVTPIVF